VIRFFDLQRQHRSLKPAIDEALQQCLREARFVRGEAVGLFEKAFATALGSRHVIGTGNGTDALFAILKCLGTGPGDEVISSAFTWISSAETISLCQARPVFADIRATDYTLDPESVERSISPRTRGVIVTHLYGQAAQVRQIRALCDQHNLFLIEDCAQAHMTSEHDQYVGTIGHAAAFSFYPTKNLGAYGDAGCIATNDDALAERLRRFCNHGALQKDDHLFEGTNSRMDTLQAAVLLVKLPFLKDWNTRRINHARLYGGALHGLSEVTVPVVRPNTVHTFHIYAIRAKNRDQLKNYLEQQGIQTMVHYPVALPNLDAYQYLQHTPNDFPVASALQSEMLSLPIYPELTEDQILQVCKNIWDFYAKHGV
jgi:dTDP-4-amino-4,6-dideoxygalactose transaminase